MVMVARQWYQASIKTAGNIRSMNNFLTLDLVSLFDVVLMRNICPMRFYIFIFISDDP